MNTPIDTYKNVQSMIVNESEQAVRDAVELANLVGSDIMKENVRIDLEQRMNAAWIQVEVASITGNMGLVGYWMDKHTGLQNDLNELKGRTNHG